MVFSGWQQCRQNDIHFRFLSQCPELNILYKFFIVLQECSVRFIYLGHLRFGTLMWKPQNPSPRVVAPSFEIIEEYTLDDQDTTKVIRGPAPKSPPKKLVSTSVVVATAVPSTEPNKSASDQTSLMVPVGTEAQATLATDQAGSKPSVTPVQSKTKNLEDDLLLSQYPWTKTAQNHWHLNE